jgi:hypothetical protein
LIAGFLKRERREEARKARKGLCDDWGAFGVSEAEQGGVPETPEHEDCMRCTYAIAEVQWVVADGEHEDWLAHRGRLCRPARFAEQGDALCELCFALAEAVYHGQTITVPVTTSAQQSETRLAVGATFEVFPDGRRAVAIGRIVSVETSEEQEFQRLFAAWPAVRNS